MEFWSRTNKRPKDIPIDYGPTRTEQHHKDKCDINEIIKIHGAGTPLAPIVDVIDGPANDLTGADFKTYMDHVTRAKSNFERMPVSIKNRFNNDVSQLLDFVQDPNNYDEAIKLNLITKPEVPSEPVTPPVTPPTEEPTP